MKAHVIIVAGGSGSRMQSETPKQFLLLEGRPLLFYTLEAFYYNVYSPEITLVLPASQVGFWEDLVSTHGFKVPHIVQKGGDSRFQSVKNGLSTVEQQTDLVAIHDGVRPFVSDNTISKCYASAAEYGSGVACVDLKDSIRAIHPEGSKSQDRSLFKSIQTPQTFQVSAIKNAFLQEEKKTFTDDASVFEADGREVRLVEGNYFNIKITTPEDMVFAKAILMSNKEKT